MNLLDAWLILVRFTILLEMRWGTWSCGLRWVKTISNRVWLSYG